MKLIHFENNAHLIIVLFLEAGFIFTRVKTQNVNIYRSPGFGFGFGFGNIVKFEKRYLSSNDKIKSISVQSHGECVLACVDENDCRSMNIGTTSQNGQFSCEILRGDQFSSNGGITVDNSYTHFSMKTPCMQTPCLHKGTCLPEYSTDDYQCTCVEGYTGRNCETAITSCKELKANKGISTSGSYQLADPASGVLTSTYCYFGDLTGCGAGEWTMIMTIDGSKSDLQYDSSLWSNKNSYNPSSGSSGFTEIQSKMPAYWYAPFTKICLGMKVGSTINYVSLSQSSTSLYSLLSPGVYMSTNIGRNSWKSLITGSSLQLHCNTEGFNAIVTTRKVRIGIINNEQNDCVSPDSFLGFGTDTSEGLTCGNFASSNPDNGDRNTPAIGYILVN